MVEAQRAECDALESSIGRLAGQVQGHFECLSGLAELARSIQGLPFADQQSKPSGRMEVSGLDQDSLRKRCGDEEWPTKRRHLHRGAAGPGRRRAVASRQRSLHRGRQVVVFQCQRSQALCAATHGQRIHRVIGAECSEPGGMPLIGPVGRGESLGNELADRLIQAEADPVRC